MRKVIVGVLVVVCSAATYVWQVGEPVTVVDVTPVTRGAIESRLQLTGLVINDRTVTLTALLDGEIMAILAREGDTVQAGTVLAELDSRQAQALLDKAEAEVVLQQQSLDAATRNHERTQRLSQEGNASRQSLDDSLDAMLAAQASLKVAQAELTLNQLRLDNAQIKSPFAGTVIQQSAETGQWLEAGQPLFKLVATEGIVIEAPVSASDWSRVKLGQVVEMSSELDADTRWQSEVSWIAPTVMEDSDRGNNVAVRFPPGDEAPPLLLGQEVDVDLSLQRVNDVLVVPLQVLQEGAAGNYSAFVLAEGRASRRLITIGLSSLSEAEVVDGLAEGEQLIITVGAALRDGQAVQARNRTR